MKKLSAIVAAAAMLFAIDASAQLSHGIRYGVVGGFTSTNTHLKEFKYSNVSLYHVGAKVKFNLGLGFAVQPALTYQVKGTDLETATASTESLEEAWKTMDARVGYLELPVQIQWGPDLMALRPYAFVEPFVGYGVNFKATAENADGAVIDNLKNKWKEACQNIKDGLLTEAKEMFEAIGAEYGWSDMVYEKIMEIHDKLDGKENIVAARNIAIHLIGSDDERFRNQASTCYERNTDRLLESGFTTTIAPGSRKYIFIGENSDSIGGAYLMDKSKQAVNWFFDLERMPSDLVFQKGHPQPGKK